MARRAAALPLALLAACSDGETPRGLLLVTIDTCRADRIGCYGARHCETPVIDGLAERGLRFVHVTAPTPLTLPSHASLLTGLYPDRHGLRDNGTGPLPDEAVTIAEALAGAGWETAAFLAAVPLEATYGTDQGFALYDDDFLPPGGVLDPLARLHTDQRTADQVAQRAVPWLRQAARGDRPFFAWVHFYDPHSPYVPPPEIAARYGPRSYEGEVAFVDGRIGELLGALGDARDRTVVAVTADHGESLGEHGEATHGFLLYEGAVRVPWVMAGPGVPRGATVDEPVSLVQVMPTLLELAGLEPPEAIDVRSALDPAARGEAFAEAVFPKLAFGWSASRSVRAGRWKYIEAPRPELFDVQSDPGETRDVSARHPGVVDSLRERLRRHFARGGALAVAGTPLDEEARARLEGLGYVGAGGEAGEEELWDFRGRDPKDVVGIFDDLQPLPDLILKRRDDDARALVASLLERDPGNAAVLRRVAQLYLRARNWEDAREICRRLLEVAPDDAEIRRGLGTATMRLGDLEGAAAVFREATRRDPQDAVSWSALGAILVASGDCAGAVPALEAASSRGRPSARVATDVADAWRECGEIERALAEYDRALAIDPAFSAAVNGRALLLAHVGRAAEAVTGLRAGLEAHPDDVEMLNNLAWILADRAIDADQALAHARRARELAPDDPSVLDTFGWAAVRAGQAAEAVEPLERAWEATRDGEVRLHLGVALAESGRVDEGRTHLRAALAERPELARIPEAGKWR